MKPLILPEVSIAISISLALSAIFSSAINVFIPIF